MAKSSPAPESTPSPLRQALQRFTHRRIQEALGLALIFTGVLWVLALASYSADDMTWNHTNTTPVQNWLGVVGAYWADASYQLFGWGVWAVLPAWISLGIRRVFARTGGLGRLRLFAWLLAAPLLATSLALAPQNIAESRNLQAQGTQAGGAVGQLLARPFLTQFMPPAPAVPTLWHRIAQQGTSWGLSGLAVLLALFAAGLSRTSWRVFWFLGGYVRQAVWWIAKEIAGYELPAPKPRQIFTRKPPAPALPSATKPSAQTQVKTTASTTPRTTSGRFLLPPINLLKRPTDNATAVSEEELSASAQNLEAVLAQFSIEGRILKVRAGPVVTLYEFEPAAGIRTSRIVSLADDIARSMKAVSCRVAVVPGQNVIGIELPNQARDMVFLRELLGAQEFQTQTDALTLGLGKSITGAPFMVDLLQMPHLLVAGTTGAGKSVGVNTMILSLLYRLSPQQCRLILIDPKILELSVYEGIPHLLAPVVTDPKKAVFALKWAIREMEQRYHRMSALGVRNIGEYNGRITQALARKKPIVITQTQADGTEAEEEIALEPLPFIVIVIDEMADLMAVAGKEIEGAVQRLAQMARAAGLHLITATQRPSVDVITGTIKANFPSRISFQVTSKIDSRTILGEQGAEQLLGKGDMLVMSGGGRIQRVHGAFVSDEEVKRVVGFLREQGTADYAAAMEITSAPEESSTGTESEGENDPLYQQAVEAVVSENRPSISFVQRRLQIGYNRAARLMEEMEKAGVVSPANPAGKRDVLQK